MARWEPLPKTLDDAARRLAVHLRRAKDRSGLSVPALAARTASSAGAWERYFDGTRLPPRDAVEALGRLSGADGERLIGLWEQAARGAADAAAGTAADTAAGTGVDTAVETEAETAADTVADTAAGPTADTGKGFAQAGAIAPPAPVRGPRHALRRRRRSLSAVVVGLALGAVFALLVAAEVATDGPRRAGTPLSARPAATASAATAPSAAASADAPAPAGSAATSRSRSASRAGATDAAASRTPANALSPDAGRPTTHLPGPEDAPPALGSAPHTAAPGGAPATGGTAAATTPGGAAPATSEAPTPPATSVPVAPTRAPTPSASPTRSPGKGHCLRLVIVGICVG